MRLCAAKCIIPKLILFKYEKTPMAPKENHLIPFRIRLLVQTDRQIKEKLPFTSVVLYYPIHHIRQQVVARLSDKLTLLLPPICS